MKDKIISVIAENQVTVVAGDTGCGSEWSSRMLFPLHLLSELTVLLSYEKIWF
jgi:hypothetical protein